MDPRKLVIILILVLAAPGCALFKRGPKVPKKDPSIPSATTTTYRDRWLEIRKSQLTSQGIAAAAAQTQAEAEFKRAFPGLEPLPR